MVTEADILNRSAPDRRPAWKELPVPGSEDKIVLISPDLAPQDSPFPNLVRRDREDTLVWIAELPRVQAAEYRRPDASEVPDAYVSVQWQGNSLAANSWAGYRVIIDPSTGKVAKTEFTK